MTCSTPSTVTQALKCRLTAVEIGPFRAEYINDAAPSRFVESEHLAILERRGRVRDVVDIESDYFASLVRHYGAEGVPEKY